MQILRFLSVAALMVASTIAGEPELVGTLKWGNGDSLKGTLIGTQNDALTWQSPLFTDPLTVDLSVLSRVEFPELKGTKADAVNDDLRITLVNGNVVFGSLVEVESKTLVFTNDDQGKFRLKKEHIHRLDRGETAGVIYRGPGRLEDWTVKGKSDWKEDDDGYLSSAKGASSLRRAMKLPTICEIELVLSSTKVPDFSLRLGGSTKSLSVRLETWDDSLVAAVGNDFEPLNDIPGNTREIHVHLFLNCEEGLAGIFAGNGQKLGELRSSKLKSIKSIGSVTIEAVDSPLTLTRLQVGKWDGVIPRRLSTGENRIQQIDGETRYGKIVGYTAGTKTIQFESTNPSDGKTSDKDSATDDEDPTDASVNAGESASFDVPLTQITSLVLSADIADKEPGETKVSWMDGGFISGDLVSLTGQSVSLKNPASDQPLVRSLAGVRQIRLPNTHKPAKEPDTLFFDGGSLHGNLTLENSDVPIRWTPVGGRNATTLLSAGDARIQRGAKPESDTIDTQKYADVIYLKSGDVVPADVKHCDEENVTLSSPVLKVKQLKTQLVRAIDLGLSHRKRQEGFASEGWKGRTTTAHGQSVSFRNGSSFGHKDVLTGDSISMSMKWKSSTYGAMTFFLFSEDASNTKSATPVTLHLQAGSISVSQQVSGDDPNQVIRFGFGGMGNAGKATTVSGSQANVEFRIRDGRVYVRINKKDVENFELAQNSGTGRGLVIKSSFARMNSRGAASSNGAKGDADLGDFIVQNVLGATARQFIQEEPRLRALTTPRFRRDDPATHIVIAPNGDLLRGRLKEIRPEEIVFESRLEEFRFPRDRVASVIWLLKSKDDVDTPPKRPKTAVQIQMDNGYTLTMTPRRMNDGKLQGDSPNLGECQIPGESIRDLFLGNPFGQSKIVSFVQWIRQDAIEPEWQKKDEGELQEAGAALIGQKVDDFELPMPDGGTFRLSDHAGKVVILDFWASWCGPCVAALPEYVEATSEFSTDEVVFVAINLEESEQRIAEFLDQHRLSPMVAMDRGSVIARRFKVSGIPHSVILNGDAVVEHVTVGYLRGVGEKTEDRIRKLLAE